MEYSVVLIKPDTIKRRLIDELDRLIQNDGLRIVKIIKTLLIEEMVRNFQPFLNYSTDISEENKKEIIDFLCGEPVIIYLIEGKFAIKKIRQIKILFRRKHAPGDDIGARAIYNLVHAPNTTEELELLFQSIPGIKST